MSYQLTGLTLTLRTDYTYSNEYDFEFDDLAYEIIKENLTRDPLKYGAYICSCGYTYSVGECTFPTVISKCPICNENIGGEHHILYKRVGHMRIFLNNESRKAKYSAEWEKLYGDYRKWDYQVNAAFVSD